MGGSPQPRETFPQPLSLQLPTALPETPLTLSFPRGYSPLRSLRVSCPRWESLAGQYCVDYGLLRLSQATQQQCLDLCGVTPGCQAVSRESRPTGACYFSDDPNVTCDQRVPFNAFEVCCRHPPRTAD